MEFFNAILAEIKSDCAWEQIPYNKISALARLCGPAEIDHLIRELDDLDDTDLVGDAGDMGDEYWRLRTSYSQALAEVGEPAIEPLLRALESANPNTRSYSATALGRIGTPRAFDPIVALLSSERQDITRISLIGSLGDLRDERAVEILLPFLKSPEQVNRGWMIRMAANALGKIGTKEVIGPLRAVLENDPDWFARLGAAEGLCEIRHPSAKFALQSALLDEDARVREVASAGLR